MNTITKKRLLLLAVVTLLVVILAVASTWAQPSRFFEQNSRVPRKELLAKKNKCLEENKPDSAVYYLTLAASGRKDNMPSDQLILCAKALASLGYINIYYFQDYPTAYSNIQASIDLAEKLRLDKVLCANYLNVGNIYSTYEDWAMADKMYRKAFYMAVDNEQWDALYASYVDLVELHLSKKGDIQPLKGIIAKMAKLQLKQDQPLTGYVQKINEALKKLLARQYQGAVQDFLDAANYVSEISFSERYVYNTRFFSSRVHLLNHEPLKSIDDMKVVLADSALSQNTDTEADAYKRMSESYALAGMHDLSFTYKVKYLEFNDSVLGMSKAMAVKNMAATHERKVFSSEIELLKEQYHASRLIIFIVSIALVVVLILVVRIIGKNRQLHQQKQDLYLRNQELLRQNSREQQMMKQVEEEKKVVAESETSLEIDKDSNPEMDSENNLEMDSGANQEKSSNRKLAPGSDFLENLWNRIMMVMQGDDEIYSPEFNVTRLAAKCDTNSRYISAAISSHHGEGFNSLLASLRINEAMRRLSDKDGEYARFTIEAISESVGFRSRTNFSQMFKKITGLTPKEYRKISLEMNE